MPVGARDVTRLQQRAEVGELDAAAQVVGARASLLQLCFDLPRAHLAHGTQRAVRTPGAVAGAVGGRGGSGSGGCTGRGSDLLQLKLYLSF